MHEGINTTFTSGREIRDTPQSVTTIQQLRHFAKEAEDLGNFDVAEKYYLEVRKVETFFICAAILKKLV